jgi:hypothetical protein
MARKVEKSKQSGQPKARKSAPASKPASTAQALPRRQVLKGVIASGGVVATAMALPSEWTKPVVQSIVASAQAQVSPPLSPFSPPSPPQPPFPPLAPSSPLFPLFPPGGP